MSERTVKADEKVFNAIVEYFEEHGYAPSTRELCDICGYKSTSSVQHRIDRLFRLGLLETDLEGIGHPRGFRITRNKKKRQLWKTLERYSF